MKIPARHGASASLAGAVLAAVLSIACAARDVPPPKAPAGGGDPQKAWANVLSKYVDQNGRIDFVGVSKDRADLDTFVGWIATTSPAISPNSFPTQHARLAYYINAYNALAMYNVLASGMPKDLSAVQEKFFRSTKLAMPLAGGGTKISLDDLENTIVRPLGDPRVHFALNCMARSSPRLPREPFRADQLDMELEAVAQYFLNENRNVQVDAGSQTVRFSTILKLNTEDFLKKAPSLVAYANKYRESKIPETYNVEFIPYDWALNQR
jgi:hypothetical protein